MGTRHSHQILLAKCSLIFNGHLANHGLTSLVEEATGVKDGIFLEIQVSATTAGVMSLCITRGPSQYKDAILPVHI